jgi:glycosyltransferase involved in cell wall biosynthesis
MKTLGVIANEFPPFKGGIARLTEDVASFASRIQSVVVFLTGTHQDAIRNQGGLVVVPLGCQVSSAKVFAALCEYGVTHVLFNHLLCAKLPLVWKCRCAGIRMWTYVHGADINMRVRTRLGIKTRLLRFWRFRLQRGVIVNSRSTQEIFRRKIGCVSSHVLLPGISLSVFGSAHPKKEMRRPNIISVGRLIRRKGFDVLLNAMRRVPAPSMLTIIGDGPDRGYLIELTRRFGITERVRFLSGLSDADVREELRTHRVFCQLPRVLDEGDVEGFGIVFIEAAASGLPVVGGKSGGVPDAVGDGFNGYLVDPLNAQEVADRLNQLLTDNELYKRMSSGSLEWAKRFDWDSRNPSDELSFMLPPPIRE